MEIADLLTPAGVIANLRATGKKQVLQELARRIAPSAALPERQVFEILLERERLGSTGIGMGVAIPHGRISGLSCLHGLFARLERSVDFAAIDDRPVDLVFLLLAPEGSGADHLKALARVSRLFRNAAICEKLRGTDHPDALYALLTDGAASAAA